MHSTALIGLSDKLKKFSPDLSNKIRPQVRLACSGFQINPISKKL